MAPRSGAEPDRPTPCLARANGCSTRSTCTVASMPACGLVVRTDATRRRMLRSERRSGQEDGACGCSGKRIALLLAEAGRIRRWCMSWSDCLPWYAESRRSFERGLAVAPDCCRSRGVVYLCAAIPARCRLQGMHAGPRYPSRVSVWSRCHAVPCSWIEHRQQVTASPWSMRHWMSARACWCSQPQPCVVVVPRALLAALLHWGQRPLYAVGGMRVGQPGVEQTFTESVLRAT